MVGILKVLISLLSTFSRVVSKISTLEVVSPVVPIFFVWVVSIFEVVDPFGLILNIVVGIFSNSDVLISSLSEVDILSV